MTLSIRVQGATPIIIIAGFLQESFCRFFLESLRGFYKKLSLKTVPAIPPENYKLLHDGSYWVDPTVGDI